jgi:hypothetical protein
VLATVGASPLTRSLQRVSSTESPVHLKAGQLGTADLTASTVANIGLGENF